MPSPYLPLWCGDIKRQDRQSPGRRRVRRFGQSASHNVGRDLGERQLVFPCGPDTFIRAKRKRPVLASLIATAIAAIAADLFLIKTFVFPGAVAGYLLAETLYLAILVVVAFRQKVFSYDGGASLGFAVIPLLCRWQSGLRIGHCQPPPYI